MSLGLSLAFGLGIVAVSAAQQQPAATGAPIAGDDKKVTITGCVLKGDDGGFLLTSVPAQPAAATPTGTSGTPPAAAASRSQVIYWLDDEDELEALNGHTVEVTGELEGDIERGEIEIEREDNVVKLEIKSDGKKVKARLPQVPAAIGTSGADDDRERELDFVVRKIDVESVKMISASCQ